MGFLMYNFYYMEINVYTDGGSRGNPGPSGYGLVIFDDQKNNLYQEYKYLGIKTNNEAEYMALLSSLNWIKDHYQSYQIDKVNFYADSQLLICQLQGIYKIKAPNLKDLYIQAQQILRQMNLNYKFIHIRRELNTYADELANKAMDKSR